MSLSSWGNYPKVKNSVSHFGNENELRALLSEAKDYIAHGNGRSYGDSALNDNLIHVKPYHYFKSFDAESGIIHCQAGVLLSEILEFIVPRGYFLQVTPGTKYITLGGAIASDVHGKNHHIAGSFSTCILEFTMMLANGEIISCSPDKNHMIFNATCGGMGLTGIILDAKIKLQPIQSSDIEQTTIKTGNLEETFEAFERYKDFTYSVAWIDCLARGKNLGRSLLMVGEHADNNNYRYNNNTRLTIPFYMPSFTLNKFSVSAFNAIYYNKVRQDVSHQLVDINSFFYPLDAIGKWNRIYGINGFTQYQFVLPLDNSFNGLVKILSAISKSGKGSFLAVLKLFGKGNDNWLSFPMRGYTLALDFRIEPGIFPLLDKLDKIVDDYGGRIYLAKDARVPREIFESGYPAIEKFRAYRQELGMIEKFNSMQSRRVGI